MHPLRKITLALTILFALSTQPFHALAQQKPVQCPPRAARYVYDDPRGIEPPLREYMLKANERELIPIVLIMERQLSEAEKDKLMANARTKKEQRAILIARLKSVAKEDQAEVLAILRALQSNRQVANVRPLWLSNVIGVRATKAAIERLARLKRIKRLHLDIPRPVKGATAWGVTKIGADSVWTLAPTPYNGTGVVVAILDTGVDYNHGDLHNRMWINTAEDTNSDGQFTAADNNGVDNDGNGFIDDVVGWNFSGAGNNDPNDVDGHGTHVAGTVAGDGTGGTSTGVAPGARIMALRESNTIALSTQQECWDGMQYALDNGADVVNFSSGWLDTWSPQYATWRNTVDNLMDGGVLFVTIAHNDSNGTGFPNNVRTPGRVPMALTVGATNSTDAIAGFSNHGPVSWQSVATFNDYPWPPGLLKPDVSAPGVGVNSTIMGGGYSGNTWDGTSMAAPHTAGLAALLLDKDPALTPYQLKYIIEETALDLGTAGADNTFGWGRIRAVNAVGLTINPAAYDLSVTGTSAVWTSSDIWVDNNDDGAVDTPVALSNNHLYARIRNISGQVVSDVEVKFYFADVSTLGISGFDPNGDGDPADGNFTYIGSYRVPTLGPAGSAHATAQAVVNWNIPTPTGDHWCVGIGIVAHNPPNATETVRTNNTAFKNFFDIITSTNTFDFNICPPPQRDLNEPFVVEFVKQNLPKDARVELVVPKMFEAGLFNNVDGLKRIADPLMNRQRKPLSEKYYLQLQKEIVDVRYEIVEDRAQLRGVVNPRGGAIPARLVIRTPDDMKERDNMLLIVNVYGKEEKPAGGLTLRILKGKH